MDNAARILIKHIKKKGRKGFTIQKSIYGRGNKKMNLQDKFEKVFGI